MQCLANMKLAVFADEDITVMREQAARRDLLDDDRVQIQYALGKALEDRGEYAASFEHYARGAALRRPSRPYSADDISAKLKAAAEAFTTDFFTRRSGYGADTDEPIFVIGLPRSGSTLVEQILASHSQVEGTTELPNIGQTNRELEKAAEERGEAYPASLGRLNAAETRALGQAFIDATRVHRHLDLRGDVPGAERVDPLLELPLRLENLLLGRIVGSGVELVPARKKGGFVGADWLRHIGVDIAVAQMTEGHWARAGNSRLHRLRHFIEKGRHVGDWHGHVVLDRSAFVLLEIR